MGKVGWYSLAVAALCAVALLVAPWTLRVHLDPIFALAAEDGGMLSLMPEDAPLDLTAGSTATNNGPASDPLAGNAPAATKRLPSASTAVKTAPALDARQQELSLASTAAVAERAAPLASAEPAALPVKFTNRFQPVPSSEAEPRPAKPAADPKTATRNKPAGAKPAAKPAAKPTAKPAAAQSKPKTDMKPAAKVINTKPAAEKQATSQSSSATGNLIAQMDLPAADQPATSHQGRVPSLRELFTQDEIDNPLTDSAIIASAGGPGVVHDVPPISLDHNTIAGVIDPSGKRKLSGVGTNPTLGQVLRGEADENEVGSSLAGYNPVRSGAMVLLVLALLFAGAWVAKKWRNPLPGFNQKALAVIETVSIGPGRQLIIVEMNNDALVLGVTPHSINMLDKVPLAELNGSYQRTVNSIIEREERALPADWQERPLFTPPTSVQPAPALATANIYGSSGRLTVSQLRKSSGYGASGHGTGVVPTQYLQERDTKAQLIDRIRQQLSNLER